MCRLLGFCVDDCLFALLSIIKKLMFDSFTDLSIWYSQPIDKQSLLDSGILCCLIHILNTLLGSTGGSIGHKDSDHDKQLARDYLAVAGGLRTRQLEVSGMVTSIKEYTLLSTALVVCYLKYLLYFVLE